METKKDDKMKKLKCLVFGHRYMPIFDLQEQKSIFYCMKCQKKGKPVNDLE